MRVKYSTKYIKGLKDVGSGNKRSLLGEHGSIFRTQGWDMGSPTSAQQDKSDKCMSYRLRVPEWNVWTCGPDILGGWGGGKVQDSFESAVDLMD